MKVGIINHLILPNGFYQLELDLGNLVYLLIFFSFVLFCFQEVPINSMLNAKTSRLQSDLMLNKAVIPVPREQSKRGKWDSDI